MGNAIKRLRVFALAAMALTPSFAGAKADVFGVGGKVEFLYYDKGLIYHVPGSNSPATFSTPGGATLLNAGTGSPIFTVTVAGGTITYTYDTNVPWGRSGISLNYNGLFITSGSLINAISGIGPITNVTLDPSSNLGSSGFSSANVTWDSTAVAVTWAQLYFAKGDTVVLDVRGVPETSTWAMALVGFGGLAFVAVRTRRKLIVRPPVEPAAF